MEQKSILLVDDEMPILESVGWALEKHNFAVTTAESGHKAIDLLSAHRYDLVVTDLSMETIDGVAVLKHAKNLYPDSSVIILTGYGNIDSAVQTLQLGADDYLQKPCEVNDLINKAQKSFERQELTARLRMQNEQLKEEIAARKIAEEKLEQSRQDLELLVAERTAELRQSVEEMKDVLQKLLTREQQLHEKNQELQDINTALNVLLKRRDSEQTETRQEIAARIMQTVLPLIKKAQQGSTGRTGDYLQTAHANLLEAFSQYSGNGLLASARLSPRELQIINYIRQGKTSKEIAELLELSVRTVEYYRENVRKKLGIKREKKNLKKFVLSLP
jgi:DNA-binding NarL/FixJ family response regulator